MRVRLRPFLFFLCLNNAAAGVSSLLGLVLRHPTASQWLLSLVFSLSFLVAAVLCLAAVLLWSPKRQRHVSIHLIRQARVASQIMSFSLLCGLTLYILWSLIPLLLLAFTLQSAWLPVSQSLLTIVWLASFGLMEFVMIQDRELTPAREDHIHDHASEKVLVA